MTNAIPYLSVNELTILAYLWRNKGPRTTGQIAAGIEDEYGAYKPNLVSVYATKLYYKELLYRKKFEGGMGREFVYEARVTREEFLKNLFEEIRDIVEYA